MTMIDAVLGHVWFAWWVGVAVLLACAVCGRALARRAEAQRQRELEAFVRREMRAAQLQYDRRPR